MAQDVTDPNFTQDWWTQNAPPAGFLPGDTYPPAAAPQPQPTPAAPTMSAEDFIKQYQADPSHSAGAGIAPLADALKSAGYDVGRYMYGNTPSNNELSLNGSKFKVIGAEDSPNTAFWYTGQGDSGGSAPLSSIGSSALAPYTPTPSYQPPTAPTYSNYNPGTYTPPAPLAAATPYALPTAAEAEATPGYQFTRDQGLQGVQRSAIAKGAGIGGGTLKELEQYGSGLADSYYGNRVSQGMNAYNTNESNRQGIYQINANTGLSAFQANANAGLGAAGLNLQGQNQQFQNTYQPSWNAYLSDIGQNQFGANYGLQSNQQQFGQGLARDQFNLGAQNQYWNQGFNENQNAYNQYDNSQKTAFDQWYKLYQSGNPGNPYA